jgi:hypothetical protein
MRKISLVAIIGIALLGVTTMNAQATRTWVSGVGDDANPCSRTAPCKTFAGAISKTAAGGEIDALDPGGFGALTITKAITLDGGGGQVASVLVSGTNGIVVAAGPTDRVIIRNLRLDGLMGGQSTPGINGIRFISGGDLNIENVYIFGFNNNCIDIALSAPGFAHIVNSVLKNCANDGIRATTTSGLVAVGIDNTSVMLSGNNGIEASDRSLVTVNRSLISASGGSAVMSDGSGGTSIVGVLYSELINGNNAATATNSSSVNVGHTTIAFNAGTAYNASGGSVFAWATGTASANNGTNRVHNTTVGTPTYITEN